MLRQPELQRSAGDSRLLTFSPSLTCPCPAPADIQQKRGINILPVAGGSHFAVRSPAYCLDFMRETASDFGGSRKVSGV